MASINASGDAAMRRTIWIGNLTSIRTVEIAATVEEDTKRGICVSIRKRAPCAAPRPHGTACGAAQARGFVRLHIEHTNVSMRLPQYCRSVSLLRQFCAPPHACDHSPRISARSRSATMPTAAATAGDSGAPMSKVPPSIA